MKLRKVKHKKLITARPSGKVRYHTNETLPKENVKNDWDHVFFCSPKEKIARHKKTVFRLKNKSKLSIEMREKLKFVSVAEEAYLNILSMLFIVNPNDTLEENIVSEIQLEQVV